MAEQLPAIYRRETPRRQAVQGPGLNFGMQALQIDAQANRQMARAASGAMDTAAGILGAHYDREQDRDHNNSLGEATSIVNGRMATARQEAARFNDPKKRKEIFSKAEQDIAKILEDTGEKKLFRQDRTKREANDWWNTRKIDWQTEAALSVTQADTDNIDQKPYNAMNLAVRSAKDYESYRESVKSIQDNAKLLVRETPEKRKAIEQQYLTRLSGTYAQLQLEELKMSMISGATGATLASQAHELEEELEANKELDDLSKEKYRQQIAQLLELDDNRQARSAKSDADAFEVAKKRAEEDYFTKMYIAEKANPAKFWEQLPYEKIYAAPISDKNKRYLADARDKYFATQKKEDQPIQDSDQFRSILIKMETVKNKKALLPEIMRIKDSQLQNHLKSVVLDEASSQNVYVERFSTAAKHPITEAAMHPVPTMLPIIS